MLMTEHARTLLGRSDEIADGESQVFTVEGREIAVFRRTGRWFAIDDHCPHKGASLAAGSCQGATVACSWHGWQFDLQTGDAIGRPGVGVASHEIEEVAGELWVRLAERADDKRQMAGGGELPAHIAALARSPSAVSPQPSANTDEWAGAFRYVVRYGAMGWVGHFRFRAAEPLAIAHGERIVIQTPRGLEIGEVLSRARTDPARDESGQITKPAGDVVRPATDAELLEHSRRADDPRLGGLAQNVLATARQRLLEKLVPVELVDAELLFDGQTVVLYFLGRPTADQGRLAVELGQEHDAQIVFNSVLELPAETSGSCGCGPGGCCSS